MSRSIYRTLGKSTSVYCVNLVFRLSRFSPFYASNLIVSCMRNATRYAFLFIFIEKKKIILKLFDTVVVPHSVLLNVILLETLHMKTSVTFLTPCHGFCMAMCTASLLLLRNNPVLETVKAYFVQSLLGSAPHALVRCNSALAQVRL